MNPESINSVIDHLANKLAVPTGQLMEMLPRLGYKDLYALITELIALGVSIILCVWLLKAAAKTGDSDPFVPFIAITGIVAIVLFLISLFELDGVLFWLHDPQAWAFDYVLMMLK